MHIITSLINPTLCFEVPDAHPHQPEWGRPAESHNFPSSAEASVYLGTLDERDQARAMISEDGCTVTLAAEYSRAVKPVPPPTPMEYEARLEQLFQSIATAWGYWTVDRLATYANTKNPQWKAEYEVFFDWRDACIAKGYQIQNDLINTPAELRKLPTLEEFIAQMPATPAQPKL